MGIVTNRLVGVSPNLEQIRQKLVEPKSNPNVRVTIKMHGVEQGDSLLELINVADQRARCWGCNRLRQNNGTHEEMTAFNCS